MAHPGLVVIHALDMPGGHYFHEILVPGIVLCQENQMKISAVVVILQVMVVMACYVYLTAYDRLHRRMLLRYVEKFLHPVHIAVIGDCYSRHIQFFGPVEQFFDVRHAVENGIFCMYVKMDEGHDSTIF